ncbi:hypothetical protein EYF80_053805 [Liparis tanakae]|uniref:Uncharacterized protein n=1 Tax=Liparis tanakae TaxID=230148 RepID=A0A4Z2F5K3_9TELE|nr:hypothetical protein EYF80_053805 [Liparis tanakae]
MTKRVFSLAQPTVFIDTSRISMLMTSRFLRLSRRNERRDQVGFHPTLGLAETRVVGVALGSDLDDAAQQERVLGDPLEGRHEEGAQRVEHGDRGGLLQAVGLEGRQHVDELQKDLSDVGSQQIFISLGSKVNGQLMKYVWPWMN